MDTNGWPAEDHKVFANIAKKHNDRMEGECMREIQKTLPYMLEEELDQHKKWMMASEGGKAKRNKKEEPLYGFYFFFEKN